MEPWCSTIPRRERPRTQPDLRRGDVIIRFDDELVDEPGDVYRLLDRTRIEKKCALVCVREGARFESTIVPVKRTER